MVMAGGQICLLVPNVPTNLVDKICPTRRSTGTIPVPRCLFGRPDPAENKRLFEEFLQKERERAKKRWGVDLDDLEAAIEKAAKKQRPEILIPEESRIPEVPADVEDRLSPSGIEEKTSCPEAPFKRSTICRKPCANFQKRVRAAGNLKRQTHLTDFWRARKSVSFVFGKNKSRTISLQSLKDLLEPSKLD
ncbi:uncharacterized protein LOC128985366 [Macrosteles quadrilineatus]|uniref:uncharacterized protein LOC128985366 n=1 Tax=Macrosteles quadrilineatus TaxID=74068 RepID=UPI0023E0D471|nr:uncharacterized protein LOC128985366 [Macrosteles quadrilineatus]